MGKQSSTLGVGATISVAAKALNERWAKSKWPATYDKERIDGLVVLQVKPPTTPSQKAHTIVVDVEGRHFEVLGSRVKVISPAPLEHQIGRQTPQPTHPQAVASPVQLQPSGDDIETDIDPIPEVSTDKFQINLDPDLSVMDTDFRTSGRSGPNVRAPFPSAMTPFRWLCLFLPMSFFQNVTIPATNSNALAMNIPSWKPLTMPELLAFLCIWAAMTFVDLQARRDYWLTSSTDWLCPPLDMGGRSGITSRRFENICQALLISPRDSSTTDRFWEIRPFLECYNRHLTEIYEPSWSSCLDESMVQYDDPSCPGWVFVERKFTDKGNEYHTIADSYTKIVYQLELVEGKDRPVTLGPLEFEEEFGKTPSLLLRLTKYSRLWGTGKVIMLDSGFCVLEGLLALRQRGVYAFAIIKRKRYWPRHIPGDDILQQASNLPLGTCLVRKGMATANGTSFPFFVAALRDSNHVVLAMSTFGVVHNTGKLVYRGPHSFQRPQVFDDYYVARHSVDDSNNIRQGHRGIEEAWETRSWAHRQFAFLFSLAEANAWHAQKFFAPSSDTANHLVFRKKMVQEAFSEFVAASRIAETRSTPKKTTSLGHELVEIPEKKRRLEGVWIDAPQLKSTAPQWRCVSCRKKTRYYCCCNADRGICKVCFGQHKFSFSS
jgi:hypothetical protein